MQISSCFHPIRLKDYRTNPPSFRYVPCGRCAGCRVSYGLSTAERIDMERKFWKYSYFITLTFDDAHLPLFQVLPSYLVHPTDHSKSLNRHISNYVISRKNFNELLTDRDRELVSRHIQLFGSIPVLSHKYLVRFFKKLNNLIYRNRYEYKQSSIRYFGIGEYGPASYRPHYHLHLFFDSDTIERDISTLVHKAWTLDDRVTPLGSLTIRPDKGKSSRYTSLYSSISVRLPKFYNTISFIRPFTIRSSRPAFGRVSQSDQWFAQTFFNATPEVYITDKYNSQPQHTPDLLPNHLESRLFPRLPYFRRLDSHERLILLCTSFGFSKFQDFIENFYHGYFFRNSSSVYSRFLSLAGEFSQSVLRLSYKQYNLLQRLWSVSRRFKSLCELYSISPEHCEAIIEQYYSKKDLLRLRRFYFLFDSITNPTSPTVLTYRPLDYAMALYTDSDHGDSFTSRVKLMDFPLFNQYKEKVLRVQEEGFAKKHSNSSNLRRSKNALFYRDLLL